MIKSFGRKETEKIFKREYSLKLPSLIQRTTMRKLWMIDAANSINDLRIPPANCLEKLKGKKKDQYSIRVNAQWRICFKWQQRDAHEIEIIDYHK
mgnify:CR=1 FL=1